MYLSKIKGEDSCRTVLLKIKEAVINKSKKKNQEIVLFFSNHLTTVFDEENPLFLSEIQSSLAELDSLVNHLDFGCASYKRGIEWIKVEDRIVENAKVIMRHYNIRIIGKPYVHIRFPPYFL